MKKKTIDEKNLFLQRLFAFAEEKGGISDVARKINKHPAIFYNLVSRDAKPSIETLEEIAAAYPDFDMNYIVRGKKTIDYETWSRLQEEIELLKREKSALYNMAQHLGKSEAVTTPPMIADLEGASEMLTNSALFAITGSRFGSQPFAL